MSEKIDITQYENTNQLALATRKLYIKNSGNEFFGFNTIEGVDPNAYNLVLGQFFGPEAIGKGWDGKESGSKLVTEPPSYNTASKTFLIERIEEQYNMMKKNDAFMDYCFPVKKSNIVTEAVVIVHSDNQNPQRAERTTPSKFKGMTIKKFFTQMDWWNVGTQLPLGFFFSPEGLELFGRMILDMALSLYNSFFVVAFRTLYEMSDAYDVHITELNIKDEEKNKILLKKYTEDFNCTVKKEFPLQYLSSESVERSQMTSKPDTFLIEHSLLRRLKEDVDYNTNYKYGQFTSTDTFNKINDKDDITSIRGEKVFPIYQKYLTRKSRFYPMKTVNNIGTFLMAPPRYDVNPASFTKRHKLPYFLDVSKGNGGAITTFNFENVLNNSYIFDGKGTLKTGESYKNELSNENAVGDIFFSSKGTVGTILDLYYKENVYNSFDKGKEVFSYASKTLRKYIINSVAIDDETESLVLFGKKMSELEEEIKEENNNEKKQISNIMKKFYDVCIKFIKDFEITGIWNVGDKNVAALTVTDEISVDREFYVKLYLSIPFTKENMMKLYSKDIDVPISFLFYRRTDIISTTAFKVLSRGGTFSIKYGNDYTQILNSIDKHSVQYNFMLGIKLNDPNSILKFNNISVDEIRYCNSNIMEKGKKNDENSVYVMALPYNFDFANLKFPFSFSAIPKRDEYNMLRYYAKIWDLGNENIKKTLITPRYMAKIDLGEHSIKKGWGLDESCYYYKKDDTYLKYDGKDPLLDVVCPSVVHYITGKSKLNENNAYLKYDYFDILNENYK